MTSIVEKGTRVRAYTPQVDVSVRCAAIKLEEEMGTHTTQVDVSIRPVAIKLNEELVRQA